MAQAQTPPSPPIWSGPYSGLTFGLGGAEMVTSDDMNESKGTEVVLFTGFNWLHGHRMLGLEADLTVNAFSDTVYGGRVPVGPTEAAVDWITTFRGRFGYAEEQIMFYVTGGLSYSDTKSNGRSYDWGYVVGGGFEQRLTRRWTWRGEALFHYYTPDRVAVNRAETERAYSVRLGILRHF